MQLKGRELVIVEGNLKLTMRIGRNAVTGRTTMMISINTYDGTSVLPIKTSTISVPVGELLTGLLSITRGLWDERGKHAGNSETDC